MRVGVNCLFMIPGEVGGTETYLRETLKAMASSYPAEELVLFTNRENDGVLRSDLGRFAQVRFVRQEFRAMNRYARIVREQTVLPRQVRRSGVDVLWSPGYTAPCLLACPAVTSILDMQYKRYPEDLTFLARVATDLLVKCACRRSRRIIAISRFSREEIVRFTRTPRERIGVTHLAADPVFADPLPADELTRRLGRTLGLESPFLLTVSNTYPHKNIAAAVRHFAELEREIPHRLVLLGQPRRGEREVEEAAAALADPGRLHRLHYVRDRDDLRALYQGADLFVFPSLYEGFGLPVLEAMMSGVPVVAARRGAVEEVAGECALFFDPGREGDLSARIREALAWRKGEREEFVSSARARAAEFSWEKTAAGTLEVLESART